MNNNSLKVVDENEWINILEKNPIPVVNKNENNNEKHSWENLLPP